jgi:uncharacterized RDD family membrane protein YckC
MIIMETVHLARWSTRFWAWLIDFIIVSLVLNVFFNPFRIFENFLVSGAGDFLLRSSGFLLYWTVMEGLLGQSAGKMVMNIRVTGRSGEKIGLQGAVIESFGKAFLLPLDCLIGWLGMPGTRLRLFNRLSDTIVVTSEYREPDGVTYVHEEGD